MDPLSVFLFLLFVGAKAQSIKQHNVDDFGGIADGQTDNSKAFLDAFKGACQYDGHSQVIVPEGTYLVKSAKFTGPCIGPIDFILNGVVQAVPGPGEGGEWFTFQYINQLTINGPGTFDAQGPTAWAHNKCSKNSKCKMLPTSIQFNFVNNSVVSGITSLNSKMFHINVLGSNNLKFEKLRIVAPDDSPNTDGIHIGHSQNVRISDSFIGTGDDCVSIGQDSRDIEVSGVHCGPGHGISIGSLGKYDGENSVSGVNVHNCILNGTDNGLRIKTWASDIKSRVYNITYTDIMLMNANNPIIIDQQYCPTGGCDTSKASQIQIEDVKYNQVRGTSKNKDALIFECSSDFPCKNIVLTDIDISYLGKDGPAQARCRFVKVESIGVQNPPTCV
ncbi:hypothetical protein SAY87_009462 [Trapa incisa]|uniref:Polygalacturonase n=1 Tax=Trapa incisa TaxID=236973 RepID=A0AAN7Q2P0_9MYRT|nr:hypothetical protein SAY87_009462 [Trapa incisa]